ncbi:MAG: RNA polymerase sigma factor [Prolixibacteraceae bacterium]|nr:RNA polymerase sigma factor [Prolixibacteraceae bacterium]MBT6007500.1 RNA polymerase sigma factor [Prolixibacteraceae bacterium]MBT6765429.1 RNA polymerase sigma factor [Prolixibacteraceae bacterium]MBT6997848.1 RNA polymerase sigma factor [Prolixibacteraceae bacterium]MBT7394437.1 RNA polymerase sigma factor [Prolixibacteraceae bacterium]
MEALYKNIHQEIIDQCKQGNQKAQFQMYKLYYKAMYSISLRIVNDEMEAEDVMQEAFLNAFNKIETYKGEVSFGAWLKKIVVNRSLDYLKKRKVQFEEVNEKTAQILDYQMGTKEIDLNSIKTAIKSLPDGYRVVLSLYLIEGYDHEEISQILGITNSASRTQFLRAKNKLREILKDKEIFSYN